MFPLLVVKLKELSPDTLVGGSTNITSEPTVQPAVLQEQRLHVTDRTSHIRFLVGSGSVVSVIPRTMGRQKTLHGRSLSANIGADFLSKFQLPIDLKNQRLIDSITGLSTPPCLAQAKHISISSVCPNFINF